MKAHAVHDADALVASLDRSLGDIASSLLGIVRELAPEYDESADRGAIYFRRGEEIVCYIWPLKSCVELGLRNGSAGPVRTIKVRSSSDASGEEMRALVSTALEVQRRPGVA